MRKLLNIAVGVAAAGAVVALGAAIKGMASTGILHGQTVSADALMLHGSQPGKTAAEESTASRPQCCPGGGSEGRAPLARSA